MLSVEIDGLTELTQQFLSMAKILSGKAYSNMLLEAIETSFSHALNNNFDDASFNGEPWKPYAEVTLKWKRRKWEKAGMKGEFHPHLLIQSGKLSTQWKKTTLFKGAASFSTNVIYAPLQQFGGSVVMPPHKVKAYKYNRKKDGKEVKVKEYKVNKPISHVIPPRPFLPDAKENYEDFLAEFKDLLNQNGLPCELKLTSYSD